MSELQPINDELVFVGSDGEPFTTSLVIASQTGNEHRAVMQLVRNYVADLNEVGSSAFEMRKTSGRPTEYAVLDEPAAALLMTYLKNTAPVRVFKKRLVAGFYELRRKLAQVPQTNIELPGRRQLAQMVLEAEDRADREAEARVLAEKRVEVEQRHRRAIEAGDGIHLTDFGKKYFSDVPARKFDEHLYKHRWLIDQRGTRVRPDGEVRDGWDHRKPTYKGRPFIYEHDTGNHGGRRRFQPRVRPQKEIELRDALAAEGLPVNEHSTGLVLITNDELKGLES